MENDYAYIGIICIDEDNNPVLITKSGHRYNISGVKGSILQKDINITEYESMIVCVKYFDGFDSVTLEYAHNRKYKDIIFAIEHHGIILNDEESTFFEMVYNDHEGLNFFWGLLEEYFETDEGMEKFENFVKKNNWKNKI